MSMKSLGSKLSQNVLKTRRSLWTGYIFISVIALVPSNDMWYGWATEGGKRLQLGSSAKWPAKPYLVVLHLLLCGHGLVVNFDTHPSAGDTLEQGYQAHLSDLKKGKLFLFHGCRMPGPFTALWTIWMVAMSVYIKGGLVINHQQHLQEICSFENSWALSKL